MANYEPAIRILLEDEGGFVNDPDDPGGATNRGITLRYLIERGLDINDDGRVDVADVEAITEPIAESIYRKWEWDRLDLDVIFDQGVAAKLFGLFVNSGDRQATLIAQRACRAAGLPVAEDGVWGPATRRALNQADPRVALAALRSESAGFYRTLCAQKPALLKFLRGWVNRAYR